MYKALDRNLQRELEALQKQGRFKAPERIIRGRAPGHRVYLEGFQDPFIRANSNDYLQFSQHPALRSAAEKASDSYGLGPGAVRFIDGTFAPHAALEKAIATFMGYPAACIFNSAYTANLSLIGGLQTPDTFWLSDALNHNSLIRGLRMAGVQKTQKAIYAHADSNDLESKIKRISRNFKRVCILTDGVFSMRGDVAPLASIQILAEHYGSQFEEGIWVIVDDSHGIGAFGSGGRGTIAHTHTHPAILVGTFGKAFGVNGGFVAGSAALIQYLKQKGDTYIYTNSIGPPEAAAALAAVQLLDGLEGKKSLGELEQRRQQFRKGLTWESIEGPHPIVPILTRQPEISNRLVEHLFKHRILATGLSFPVVPENESCVRVQLHAGMSIADIEEILKVINTFKM